MNGRLFAPKDDPEHDDFELPSDTDSEYRHFRVYDAAGRTDYADRMIRGLAADGAPPSCAESTAVAAPSFAESAAPAAPSRPIGTEVLQPIDSRLLECLYCKFWIRPGKGDTSGKYHKYCATRTCEAQHDTHGDRVRRKKRIRDDVAGLFN